MLHIIICSNASSSLFLALYLALLIFFLLMYPCLVSHNFIFNPSDVVVLFILTSCFASLLSALCVLTFFTLTDSLLHVFSYLKCETWEQLVVCVAYMHYVKVFLSLHFFCHPWLLLFHMGNALNACRARPI